jgi:hypothetical protein
VIRLFYETPRAENDLSDLASIRKIVLDRYRAGEITYEQYRRQTRVTIEAEHYQRFGSSAQTITHPQTVSEVENTAEPVSFVVEDLLMRGGTTLLIGLPKQGKSTLAKQLAVAVAKGESVINRRVTQGTVLYYQMEESKTWTTGTLRKMGISDADPLLLVFDRPEPGKAISTLRTALNAHPDVALLVLDMMAKVINVKDFNDYAEVTAQLEPLTLLARQTGVSILLLHHGKKSSSGDPINDALGSIALTGNVDIIVGLSGDKITTRLSTNSRVGQSLRNVRLTWDAETHLYSAPGEEVPNRTTAEQAAIAKDGAHAETFRPRRFDHGDAPEYLKRIWRNNKEGKRKSFQRSWAENPRIFYDYILNNLGVKPTDDHSLDCIANERGYCEGNLRWATKREQSCNQRRKNTAEVGPELSGEIVP